MQNRMENQAHSHGIAGFGYSRRLARRRLIGSIIRPRSRAARRRDRAPNWMDGADTWRCRRLQSICPVKSAVSNKRTDRRLSVNLRSLSALWAPCRLPGEIDRRSDVGAGSRRNSSGEPIAVNRLAATLPAKVSPRRVQYRPRAGLAAFKALAHNCSQNRALRSLD